MNYYMSGIKLSCPIYYSHYSHVACVCLVNNFEALFVFVWYDLIFECKMILLGRAYQNILFGNLNIFGKYLTQGLCLSTHLFIRPVCLKNCLSKLKHFVWLIVEYVFLCSQHTIRHMFTWWPQHTPSCTWMPRTSPPWSSTQGISARTSPCSPFQWPRHLSAWFCTMVKQTSYLISNEFHLM